MQADPSYIRWFPQLSLEDRPAVGGKSASLGELTRAEFPVPPGFVLTTAAFEEFLASNDPRGEIRAEIAALDTRDPVRVASVSERIRERLLAAPMPRHIVSAIAESYRQLSSKVSSNGGGCPVAVRSSATCEDSATASFAGLQDTYLWVPGEDELIGRIRACWASLYNSESITYRLRLGLPEGQLAMAVVVQQMIDALCAGVMFTRSPTTGDRSVVVIEGSWGLGSCIVSGEVTPDRFVVNKVTGEIVTRNVSAKLIEHVPDRPGGGVHELTVDPARRDIACLTDAVIGRLWQMARQVEQHYGNPQDIEWAVSRESTLPAQAVYLLQSRPETVWSNREKAPAAKPAEKPFDHVVQLMSARKKRL
jgi:pyruvate,water dikinase